MSREHTDYIGMFWCILYSIGFSIPYYFVHPYLTGLGAIFGTIIYFRAGNQRLKSRKER